METNGLGGHAAGQEYHAQERTLRVYWDDDRLDKITRLRLLSDPCCSWWDVKYCHGVLADGTLVNVTLPFSQLRKGGINAQIIKYAREDKVFAKGLGVFDAISTLC
jgi:hypothetical protein